MKKSLRLASVALALVMVTSVMLSGTFAKYTSEFSGQDTALVARWTFSGANGMVEGNTPTPKTLDLFSHAYDEYITTSGTDSDGNTSSIIAPGVDGEFNIEFSYTGDVDAAITLALEKTVSENGDVPLQFSLSPNFSDFTYNLNDLSEKMLKNLYYTNAAAKPEFDILNWTKIGTGVITANTGKTNEVYLGSTAINPALIAANGLTTAPANTVVVTKTDEATNTTYVSIPVYWRWPYDVSLHNSAKLAAGGFPDTWTDASDTALGNGSQTGPRRLEYKIKTNIIASQVVPVAGE